MLQAALPHTKPSMALKARSTACGYFIRYLAMAAGTDLSSA